MPAAQRQAGPWGRRSLLTKAVLILVGIALFLGFLSLGTWQVQRRSWKIDLMERVDQRVHAASVALPSPADWPRIDASGYEYLPVTASGQWLPAKTVLTQAATDLGAGFWVLTPLQQVDGSQVLVNRGFVPQDQRSQWLASGTSGGASDPAAATPGATVTVQGLLRMTEPGGGFLRTNDPAQQRWYSRDVAGIAAAQGLTNVAPFFVDAGIPDARAMPTAAAPTVGDWPRAGMTVIRFHNSHVVYALTWYGLALMIAGAAWYVARYEFRSRAAHRESSRHASQR